jgi:hypothetical protein
VQIAALGDTQQELVAMVLTALSDDASSTDIASSMPAQRQSEVMQVQHRIV